MSTCANLPSYHAESNAESDEHSHSPTAEAGSEAVCRPGHSDIQRDDCEHVHLHDTSIMLPATVEVTANEPGEREDAKTLERDINVSRWRSERNVTFGLLLATTYFLFADQNLMAPNLTDIARSFNMTDLERDTKLGGEISLSLFLVGAPVSLVVGFHADRVNRKKLYGTVVLLGETGCLLTAFVSKYWQLFVLRALTGVALGGAMPLIYSMLADMYPASERPRASAFVGLTMGMGVGGGQMLAAVLGSSHGWRTPFIVVAAPCLVVLALFIQFGTEPKRGSQEEGYAVQQQAEMEAQKRVSTENLSLDDRVEEATSNDVSRRRGLTGLPIVVRGRLTRDKDNHYRQIRIPVARHVGQGEDSSSHKIFEKIPKRSEATMQTWAHIWVFVRLLQRPSNVLLFLQGIPGCMPWGVIGVFLNDYFITDRNAPSKIGAFAVCATYGLGTVIGQIAGGFLGKRLYQWKHEYLCYLLGTVQILSIGPLLLMLNLPFDFRTLVPISVVGGIFGGYASPNVKAVLLNVNTPDTRGSAMALFSLSDDIGKGLGPPLIGILITHFGRQKAFSIAACMWLWSGLLLLALSRTIVADEDSVARQVAIQQQERHPHLGIADTTIDIDRTEESGDVEAKVARTPSAELSVNDVGARL